MITYKPQGYYNSLWFLSLKPDNRFNVPPANFFPTPFQLTKELQV